jgi:hypothetical protein
VPALWAADGAEAARRSTLIGKEAFRSRFDDFYDMDFAGPRGSLAFNLARRTHQSSGQFGAKRWTENYRKYLDKWTD